MRARLHLLDWLACVAGARDVEAGHLGWAIFSLGWERSTYPGNAGSVAGGLWHMRHDDVLTEQ